MRATELRLGAGIAAGFAGGIAASALMLGFQRLWSSAADRLGRPELKPGPMFDRLPGPEHQRAGDGRANASEEAGQKVARAATGISLGSRGEKSIGVIGHFAYGAAMGAIYGAVKEARPRHNLSTGIGFGIAVYLLDQLLLPALRLPDRPDKAPLSTQAFGAANHLLYGAATELVRSQLRRAA